MHRLSLRVTRQNCRSARWTLPESSGTLQAVDAGITTRLERRVRADFSDADSALEMLSGVESGAQDRERVLAAVVLAARGDLQHLQELVEWSRATGATSWSLARPAMRIGPEFSTALLVRSTDSDPNCRSALSGQPLRGARSDGCEAVVGVVWRVAEVLCR